MKTLIACLVLLLVGCGEQIENAPKAGDVIQLPPIEWHVVSQRQLQDAYERHARPLADNERLTGFVGLQGGKQVMYTLAPSRVDDKATCVVGHELLHVAIGSYHQ